MDLKSYIRAPANRGENRAAWQRVAVNMMPDSVGYRIESVITANGGWTASYSDVKQNLRIEYDKNPQPGLEEIIRTIARKNNSGQGYKDSVWNFFNRTYGGVK